MTIIRTQPNTTAWRDKYKELKAGLDRFNQYQPIMTQYEQATIVEDLRRKREMTQDYIIRGMVQEYHQVVNAFEDARKAEARERAAEINRWDSGKLAAEIQLTQARLADLAGVDNPGSVVDNLMQEAEASGDIHKLRAVAEVVKSALTKMGGAHLEDRLPVNRVARRAEQVLDELRTTEGMQKANQEATQAFDAIWAKAREMQEIEQVLGVVPDFYQAQQRVQVDRHTGKIDVLPVDDSRVTGGGNQAETRERLLGH
ncbi:MAG: hypothetical protein WC657_07410 [Candidatus Paceibacterota bacterium]|jgi:hypothetical protein